MSIDDIKKLIEKFAGNFSGDDLKKVMSNGDSIISTLSSLGGNSLLGGLAKSALGNLGLGGSSNDLVDKALAMFGTMAKTDKAKLDLSNLTDGIKKFLK